MTGRLNGRVSRLEHGCAGPCEECGFDGDWSKAEIVVEWDAIDALEAPVKEDATEPRYCGTCGHQLEYVVTWADLPEPELEARE